MVIILNNKYLDMLILMSNTYIKIMLFSIHRCMTWSLSAAETHLDVELDRLQQLGSLDGNL